MLSLYRGTSSSATTTTNSNNVEREKDEESESEDTRPELRRFYTFGSKLNAHPDILHGGVVACILDSTIANGIGAFISSKLASSSSSQSSSHSTANTDLAGKTTPEQQKSWESERLSMFTAQLNIKYEAPVRTPGTVIVRSWIVRSEEGGRKIWAVGVVESLDKDGISRVRHAMGEGLWVRGKPKGKL